MADESIETRVARIEEMIRASTTRSREEHDLDAGRDKVRLAIGERVTALEIHQQHTTKQLDGLIVRSSVSLVSQIAQLIGIAVALKSLGVF